jgi:hypothetical protein
VTEKSVIGCHGIQCSSLDVIDCADVTMWTFVIYLLVGKSVALHLNLIILNAVGIAVIFTLEHCFC